MVYLFTIFSQDFFTALKSITYKRGRAKKNPGDESAGFFSVQSTMNEKDDNIEIQENAKKNIGVRYYACADLFVCQKRVKAVPFNSTARSAITRFSKSSGMRMRRYLRGCDAEYKTMVTLTYPSTFPTNGKESKEHLRRFIQELRRNEARKHPDDTERFSVFWFLEFQKRGAPHYHLFTTCFVPWSWVATTWYKIVGSENIYHLKAGTRTESLKKGRGGTISYASKYAVKMEQKTVPEEFENVGRFWGVTGLRTVVEADIFVSRYDMQDTMVTMAQKRIKRLLKRAKREGKLKVLASGPNNYVARISDVAIQKKLRAEICRLNMATLRFGTIFDDAEVEP